MSFFTFLISILLVASWVESATLGGTLKVLKKTLLKVVSNCRPARAHRVLLQASKRCLEREFIAQCAEPDDAARCDV